MGNTCHLSTSQNNIWVFAGTSLSYKLQLLEVIISYSYWIITLIILGSVYNYRTQGKKPQLFAVWLYVENCAFLYISLKVV
jgi:hypothetical protein